MKGSFSYPMARFISATCKMHWIEPISQVRLSLEDDHFISILEWGLPNGMSFNETFDGWVRQCGHPVLTVSQSEDTIKIDQERFMHFGKEIDKPESSLGYKWNVPISYVDKDGNYNLEWMLTDEQFELKGNSYQILFKTNNFNKRTFDN